MIHHRDAPWFPSDDSPVNVLFSDDLCKTINDYIKDNNINLLPEEYSMKRLSLTEDRAKIAEFISRFYGNDKWRLEIDRSEFEFMNDSNNTCFLGFTWRGLLVATVSIELFDMEFDGKHYKAFYGDHLLVHPKFRSTGLCNIVITNAIIEGTKMGAQLYIFTTHAPLKIKTNIAKRLYNLALTEAPRISLDPSLIRYFPHPITAPMKITPTLEHVKRFNETDYKMRFIYNDEQLNAMLKHDLIYTNDSTVLRFNTIINICNGVRIKTAVLQDYINCNNTAFFNEVLVDLQSKGYDMVTLFNDRVLESVISKFHFTKNSEMKLYTVNFLPKLKPNDIHVNVR